MCIRDRKRLEELHKEGKISDEVYRKLKEEYEKKIKEMGG